MQTRLPVSGTPHILSVTDLTTLLRTTLDAEFGVLWVAGEVSNVRRPPSGHLYFTLKDERSQLAAVMFRQSAQVLLFDLVDGVEVVARGRLGLYAARGDLQLYVEAVEPRGLGALQLAFEQLRARLEAEGLFAPERKRPLPFLPRCVGVVTALGGAAIHDILVTLRRRHPGVDVRIRPVRVQGIGAGAEIAAAIADLNEFGGVDVIIVGRGGGSMEDLWAFNEEVVARAIVASSVPVVSAVGHQMDFTIADFVADVRVPTPTAAAQVVVPDRSELGATVAGHARALRAALLREITEGLAAVRDLRRRLGDPRRHVRDRRLHVDQLWRRAARGVAERTYRAEADMQRLALHLTQAAPRRQLGHLRERVGAARVRLALGMAATVEQLRGRSGRAAAKLESLSPLAVLDRGYAIVWRETDGALVRDADHLRMGERIQVRFARGTAWARVEPNGS
jgi:exodeoxyribonuclease VII large subunit